MSREALVLLVCCCDFRDGAEWLIPSKSLRNAVIRAFPGLFCILRMCAPRRAAAVVRPRGREKSADRRRRILISRLLIIRAAVPRWKSPFPAYFKGFPAVSPLIPPYPAFLKYPVSPHLRLLPPVFPALQHYSRHADPLRRSGHQPHAGRLSGKLRLFRPQLLHWPDTVGYSAKAYFLRHRRPRAQLGTAGAVPSGQRSGHLRPGDDTTGQRDALASLAVNRPRQQKIPGAPKACRVSASHCICSQPIKARCAG